MENEATSGHGLQILNDNGQAIQSVIGATAKPLQDVLMENIRRVQQDASFIPQAKEIRDTVREMVNLARVEVDAYREFRKTK